MSSTKIALVTGANQGIGFGIVSQLAQQGHIVYLGSRSVEKGNQAVSKLDKEVAKNIKVIQLDVTDDKSVASAVEKFKSEQDHLDALVNNAGILLDHALKPTKLDVNTIKSTYETNVFGVVRVTYAFIDLLRKSSNPVISNVTSGLGSFTVVTDKNLPWSQFQYAAYNSSKSALNMYTVAIANDFPEARVNIINPGYVATSINNNSGYETVENSAKGIIERSILIDRSGPTASFLNYKDEAYIKDGLVPW